MNIPEKICDMCRKSIVPHDDWGFVCDFCQKFICKECSDKNLEPVMVDYCPLCEECDDILDSEFGITYSDEDCDYDLEDEEIVCFKVRLLDFQEGLVHCTTESNYRLIIQDGFIRPNDGTYEFSTPASETSYAYKNSLGCLFDLRKMETKDIGDFIGKAGCFFEDKKVLIIDPSFVKDLLPNKTCSETWGFVPIFECWFKEPIPIEGIHTVIDMPKYDTGSCDLFSKSTDEDIDEAMKRAEKIH
jgi:hypothetical protein